jgi:peptidoglycan hydrolase CwlO-like protein
MAEDSPKIETVNFDGEAYAVEDLTSRVVDGFNTLVRLQQDVQEQAYQLKKSQSAQNSVSGELKAMIQEDKIKPLQEETPLDDTSTE